MILWANHSTLGKPLAGIDANNNPKEILDGDDSKRKITTYMIYINGV